MRIPLIILLFIISIVPKALRIQQESNGNFSPTSVEGSLAVPLEWVAPDQNLLPIETVKKILKKKFHYLGKGAQCYAFGSDEWVLKLVKWRHLRPHPAYQYLPSWGFIKEREEKSRTRRQSKLTRLFTGFHVAAFHYTQETGIGYIHLNQQLEIGAPVTLVDRRGIEMPIDPDATYWVLQKRMQPLDKAFDQHIENKNFETLRNYIDQIIHLVTVRAERGIFDSDPLFLPNYGVGNDGTVMLLDVGQLKEEQRPANEQLKYNLAQLRSYLERSAPPLLTYLDQKIQEVSCAN